MSENADEQSKVIVVTIHSLNGTSIGSFTMESDTPISKIREELRHGDRTALSLLSSMIYLNFLRLEREMNEENLREQSTVKHLSDYRYTLSLSRLLHISSHLETLER